jgi:hypothetical protein
VSVVDLSGRPLAGIPEQDRALAILKHLVAAIEDGQLKLNWVYVLAETDDPNERANVLRKSWDTGLTVADAVYHLEMEKHVVLKMMEGEPA